MAQALNTPKGRTVEAVFSHALHICRLADAKSGSHSGAWDMVRPLFESELRKCRGANFEFSTFCGAYLPQLSYLDEGWTRDHLGQIFPAEYPANSICALDGLGYASFTKPIYAPLMDSGVLDRGLHYALKGRDGREKLVERIGAAYFWGDESLESSRFSHLFEAGDHNDLETIARLFWSIRGAKVSDEQLQRILQFWERCVEWSQGRSEVPKKLLSSLAGLTWCLRTADGREQRVLQAVAPYVHLSHATYEFIEQLRRLAEVSPAAVSAVLGTMIKAHLPEYDYKDELKNLLRTLSSKGVDIVGHLEPLHNLPGIQELFDATTPKA
jgi:hypothetical protein